MVDSQSFGERCWDSRITHPREQKHSQGLKWLTILGKHGKSENKKKTSNGCSTVLYPKKLLWRVADMSCSLYQAFEEFSLTHHLESCDSSEENNTCLEKRNMALMCMALETIECTTLRKCSENGKTPNACIKTLPPLTDSMLDMMKLTKNG